MKLPLKPLLSITAVLLLQGLAHAQTGNTLFGNGALFDNTTGDENSAFGDQALTSNTTGSQNTGIGYAAIPNNLSGNQNTGVGRSALNNLLDGSANTAVGNQANYFNEHGSNNAAFGSYSLWFGETSQNTALGANALKSQNITQSKQDNVAVGYNALTLSVGESYNTIVGSQSLASSSGGGENTALGYLTLKGANVGDANIAIGSQAGPYTGGAEHNISIGFGAGGNPNGTSTTGSYNLCLGDASGTALTTGTDNVFIGRNAGNVVTTGSDNILINSIGVANDTGAIRIGGSSQNKVLIQGIWNSTVAGAQVYVFSSGRLGINTSSARFKDDIQSMDKASEDLMALRPVTFRYKKELEVDERPHFGLVAEEVEKVNPDLVVHDADGKPFTVRYEAVNAMLLNEFQKEHKRVEAQQKVIEDLAAKIERLTRLVEEKGAAKDQ